MVIESTIAAMSKASDAAELNMEEVIAEAKDALVDMKLAVVANYLGTTPTES